MYVCMYVCNVCMYVCMYVPEGLGKVSASKRKAQTEQPEGLEKFRTDHKETQDDGSGEGGLANIL